MTPNLFRERKGMGIELNNKELVGRFSGLLAFFLI
jgi:hypothetical protein